MHSELGLSVRKDSEIREVREHPGFPSGFPDGDVCWKQIRVVLHGRCNFWSASEALNREAFRDVVARKERRALLRVTHFTRDWHIVVVLVSLLAREADFEEACLPEGKAARLRKGARSRAYTAFQRYIWVPLIPRSKDPGGVDIAPCHPGKARVDVAPNDPGCTVEEDRCARDPMVVLVLPCVTRL